MYLERRANTLCLIRLKPLTSKFTLLRYSSGSILDLRSIKWYSRLDSNQHCEGFKPSLSAVGVREHVCLVAGIGVEPICRAYETQAVTGRPAMVEADGVEPSSQPYKSWALYR